MTTRATQPDLFARGRAVVRQSGRATRLDTSPPHRTITPFDFERDGTPLVPDPTWTPPEWLHIPLVDDPP